MKILYGLTAIALLAIPAGAIAAQQTMGIVESVNVTDGTLELQSGQTFVFNDKAELAGLLPGQAVGVSHEGERGIGTYNPHPGTRRHGETDGF